MTGKSFNSLQLVLTGDETKDRIVVDMDAFLEFSFDITENLQNMVDDWSHFASPQATRQRRAKH